MCFLNSFLFFFLKKWPSRPLHIHTSYFIMYPYYHTTTTNNNNPHPPPPPSLPVPQRRKIICCTGLYPICCLSKTSHLALLPHHDHGTHCLRNHDTPLGNTSSEVVNCVGKLVSNILFKSPELFVEIIRHQWPTWKVEERCHFSTLPHSLQNSFVF